MVFEVLELGAGRSPKISLMALVADDKKEDELDVWNSRYPGNQPNCYPVGTNRALKR